MGLIAIRAAKHVPAVTRVSSANGYYTVTVVEPVKGTIEVIRAPLHRQAVASLARLLRRVIPYVETMRGTVRRSNREPCGSVVQVAVVILEIRHYYPVA